MRLLAICLAVLTFAPQARAADDFVPIGLGGPTPPPPAAKKKDKPKVDKKDDDDFVPIPLPLAPTRPPPAKKDPPPPPLPEVTRKKAPPSRVVISGTTNSLNAGEKVTLTVKVYDSTDSLTTAELKVSADQGAVTNPTEANGVYTFSYTAPKTIPGPSATVKVAATGPGVKLPPSDQFVVTFIEGLPPPPPITSREKPSPNAGNRPAKVVFVNTPEVRPGETAKFRFHVEDSSGEKVSVESVELRSNSGTISNVREASNGDYLADFTPDEKERGELKLYGESGGKALVGEGTVMVAKSGAIAEDRRIGLNLSAFAGGMTNLGKLASPQFELAVEAAVTPSVHLGILGGFTPSGATITGASGSVTNVSMSIIPLLARAGFYKELGPVIGYGGGMAGVAFVSGSVKGTGAPKPFSQAVLDLALFGGAGLPLGPGILLAELRGSRVPLDYQDKSTKVKGALGGLSLSLGYTMEF